VVSGSVNRKGRLHYPAGVNALLGCCKASHGTKHFLVESFGFASSDQLENGAAAVTPAGHEPLLSVRDLSVSYGGVTAVQSVDLDVVPGALVGLIGPNGAGKTTFLDALSGFVDYSGSVVFDGKSLDRRPPHRRQHLGLTRTFQSLELYDDLTLYENLVISVSPSMRGIVPELLWGHKPKASERVDELVEIFKLQSFAHESVAALSQGQRKLVAVARALASSPRLILLDEPAAGLDTSESRWLGQELRQICERGTTLLLVDHDMSLVLGICDHVHVLDFGKLIASGTPEEIRTDPKVIAAYLGRSESDRRTTVQ
jgi:branched-chain amino acid transport system ATP-binding protein